MLPNDLEGKVCLVTGASRGIGAAVARALGRCGARVAVHYRSARQEAEAVAADIAAAGGRSLILQADVRDGQALEGLFAAVVSEFGHLDVLINNAGDQIERREVAATSDELFDRHISINVRPVFVGCRMAVRQFRAQGTGGTIVNVSSIAARTGGAGGSAIYAGAKAFVSTFTRSLAKEVAAERIRVNAVAPGVVATPMQDRVSTEKHIKAALAAIPMGRIAMSEECAGAFLFLCSERLSGYMTGQVLEVNGGLLMP